MARISRSLNPYLLCLTGLFFLPVISLPLIAETQVLVASLSEFDDPATLKAQLALEDQLRNDLIVLTRIEGEQKLEKEQVVKNLEDSFGIQRDRNYKVDLDALSIVEVDAENQVIANRPPIPFDDAEAKDRFVRTFTRKRLLEIGISSLQLIRAGKRGDLVDVRLDLKEIFKLSPESERYLIRDEAVWRRVPDPAPVPKSN